MGGITIRTVVDHVPCVIDYDLRNDYVRVQGGSANWALSNRSPQSHTFSPPPDEQEFQGAHAHTLSINRLGTSPSAFLLSLRCRSRGAGGGGREDGWTGARSCGRQDISRGDGMTTSVTQPLRSIIPALAGVPRAAVASRHTLSSGSDRDARGRGGEGPCTCARRH